MVISETDCWQVSTEQALEKYLGIRDPRKADLQRCLQ